MLTFRFTGADGCMMENETLTSGMIGKKVKLEFSSEWSELRKTAVFMAGTVIRDVLDVTDEVEIPAEVLAVPLKQLYVGVYGVSADGTVTPTIRAQGPMIEPGTDPSGDEGTKPELPVWTQILASIGELKNLNTADKNNLVAAINEAAASGGGKPDQEQIHAIISEALEKAKAGGEFDGAPGENGKSAYQYALDGGYTGTEEAFAAKLAAENGTPDAVQYTPQSLTPEQQAQARENIGAVTTADVVGALSGGADLVADVNWEPGYFYWTGGNATESNDYFGYNYRIVGTIPVTPGATLKYTLRLPYPRDASTGLTGYHTGATVAFGEYDSSNAWIQRTMHNPINGTISDGYERFNGQYTVPDNVYYLRIYITTFKENPKDIFAVYVGDRSGGMRILPEATAANDGKIPVVSGSQYVLVDMPDNEGAADAPKIVGTAVGDKAMEFSTLMNGTGDVESFVFFADPHFMNSIDNEAQMRSYLDVLKLHYDATPTSFVIGGGDWYGNSDTYDSACFKMGYIDGWMRRLFGERYYPALGNHDTNQQGRDETGGTWTGILPKETVRNLWFREYGDTYYAFDGGNTRFYVLDTWKEGTDAAYYWEQIAWLGEKLKTDNADNVALIMHIGYSPSGDSYAVNTLVSNALSMCEAFNKATSITLNGVTYDFSGCTGKVRFAMSGHIHVDYATIVKGIPLIATTHMRDGNTPTFDMCLADYGSNKLSLIRVGTGENRQFTMGPDGAILDGTEDNIVLLLGMNITGYYLYNNVKFRSLYVGRVQPDGVSALGWSSASTGEYPYPEQYYPIEIPDGATRVVVTCPDSVKWAVHSWDAANAKTDSGWLTNGNGAYEFPAESKVLLVLFNDNNAADMSADTYDSSSFSLTFDSSTEDDTPEEVPTLPVTFRVEEPIVFLSQCNHSGGTIDYYNRPTRALIATTENTGAVFGATSGTTTDTTHYALALPDGASAVTVYCPDELEWAFDTVNEAGVKVGGLGAWFGNGESGTIPVTATGKWYLIKFHKKDESAFAADYDYSGISWTFS